jgi:antitoxin MazE
MENVVRARIVRIGNSRGIRIPKVWLEQLQLGEEVELSILQDQLLVRRARVTREGWGEAFRRMAEHQDDRLVDRAVVTQWDEEEWEW